MPTIDNTRPKHFIVCFIEESQVNVAVCEVVSSGPRMIATAKPKEWQDELGLSDAVEVALDELAEAGNQINDVLFGLPEDWVDGADIKENKKEILKKLSQKLSWKPLGFVVSLEAVSRYVSHAKGIVSALFFDISPSKFTMVLFDHGHIAKQEEVGRSDDFIADVKEGLARLKTETIPNVFFLFSSLLSSEQMEHLKQVFIAHDWLKESSFVQFPSVDFFSLPEVLEAVCIMGGGEALKVASNDVKPAIPSKEDVKPAQPDEFGFVEVSAEKSDSVATSFGVPITPDAMKRVPPKKVRDDSDLAIALDEAEDENSQPDQPKKKRWSFPFFGKKTTQKPPQGFSIGEVKEHKKTFAFRFFPQGLLLLAVILLLVVGGAYVYMLQTFSVIVEAVLQTKPISTQVQITLDPDIDATDPAKGILKASVKTKTVTGSQETSTTGSKIIGEKATGKITLTNKTENEKTFSQGTEVTGGGKKFTLDDEVKVASATAKETNDSKTLEYGKAEVSVTASEIGAEFNIEKEQDFTIANFSTDTYSARNDKEFAGGSSREIQAVSKDDYQRLVSSLKKDLTQEAQKALQDEKADGEYILLTDTVTMSNEEYSAEIGEETNSVKLTASLEAEAYSYFASDLKPIAQQYLMSQVPDEGVLLEDSLGILSKESDTATKSGLLSLEAELSAEYAPPTHSDEWLEAIKGSSVAEAERLLADKDEIQSVSFSFTPTWIRSLIARLPGDLKRIQLNKKIE